MTGSLRIIIIIIIIIIITKSEILVKHRCNKLKILNLKYMTNLLFPSFLLTWLKEI
jgi:hypothetical protein